MRKCEVCFGSRYKHSLIVSWELRKQQACIALLFFAIAVDGFFLFIYFRYSSFFLFFLSPFIVQYVTNYSNKQCFKKEIRFRNLNNQLSVSGPITVIRFLRRIIRAFLLISFSILPNCSNINSEMHKKFALFRSSLQNDRKKTSHNNKQFQTNLHHLTNGVLVLFASFLFNFKSDPVKKIGLNKLFQINP